MIFVCLAKSSADVMGESMSPDVRKAARLAVYDEIMISVKNHQKPATIRVDVALDVVLHFVPQSSHLGQLM